MMDVIDMKLLVGIAIVLVVHTGAQNTISTKNIKKHITQTCAVQK